MTELACLGGTGDTYLVAALARAFSPSASLVVKASHAVVAEMFDLPYRADDALIAAAEHSDLRRTYENVLGGPLVYPHPCFRGGRLDDLTTRAGHASQADIYRSMLGLPLDTPLAKPRLPPPSATATLGQVLLIPEAVSWPNSQPTLWERLRAVLSSERYVVVTNDPAWSLACLFEECAAARLVCGSQCGVMSILCAAEFPCAKALLTPSIDDGPGFPVGQQMLRRTYPYARVTRFSGNDYAVLERRVTDDNHAAVVSSVLRYAERPHDPRPVATVFAPLSPGDFLDRLAILDVKVRNLGPRGPEAEAAHYTEIFESLDLPPEAHALYHRLVALHAASWDAIERTVRAAPGDPVIAANTRRVALRAEADALLGAPWSEVKSYYAA